MRLLAAALGALAAACRPGPPPRAASEVFHDRVCHVVLAAYALGARPAFVEVEVPGPEPRDPPSRVVLAGSDIPRAEQCMGIAARPTTAVVESARSPRPPASPAIEAERREPPADPLSTRR